MSAEFKPLQGTSNDVAGRPGSRPVGDRFRQKLKLAVGERVFGAVREPSVVEVMLNADGRLWIEKLDGSKQAIGEMSEANAMSLISTIAAATDAVVTPLSPILEAEIETEKIRFEGVIPPVVPRPVFCIRKHSVRPLSLFDYHVSGLLSTAGRHTLKQAILNRSNLLISGGTGSGKTTFARAILHSIAQHSPDHRLVIIEDTSELYFAGEDSVSMRVSPSVSAQDLLRATMRLRPDRIIVGEVRGGEALTLLKAWNTGHPGGVSTIHANSARSALTRLEQLVAEVSATPMPHVIGEAIDLVVHLERSPEDGVRRVVEILSVEGYRDGEYLVTPIERVKR